MSLDIHFYMEGEEESVFDCNVTHNLSKMADAAGIYKTLWYPEEIGITKASDLIHPLEDAITDMGKRPEYYQYFNAKNGWGTYYQFVPWLIKLLNAAREYPDATISISR